MRTAAGPAASEALGLIPRGCACCQPGCTWVLAAPACKAQLMQARPRCLLCRPGLCANRCRAAGHAQLPARPPLRSPMRTQSLSNCFTKSPLALRPVCALHSGARGVGARQGPVTRRTLQSLVAVPGLLRLHLRASPNCAALTLRLWGPAAVPWAAWPPAAPQRPALQLPSSPARGRQRGARSFLKMPVYVALHAAPPAGQHSTLAQGADARTQVL